MDSVIDESECPFCGGRNLCGVNAEEVCWCRKAEVPKSLLALVPEHLKRKSCICQRCITLFREDARSFTKGLKA